METILYLAHTEPDGSLAKAAYETLTAARTLAEGLGGAALSVGLCGASVQSAADSLSGCGAARILGAEGPEFAQPRYASDTAAAEALCRAAQASIVIAPATSRFGRIMAGVAYRLGGRADTHVSMVSVQSGVPQVTRWYYRQRMVASLQRSERPWILTLDPGNYTPWKGEPGSVSVERVSVKLPEAGVRTNVTGVQAPAASQQTIRPEADVLLVAGAGWTKKQRDGQMHPVEAEKLILGFLEKAQASLGGSKSIVDQRTEGQAVLGFMTHLNQVGQTGATPRHPKGLSTCCHGEEPHVVGWRFVNERRAINLDQNCGWAHGKADVVYVADAFEVMEKLNSML